MIAKEDKDKQIEYLKSMLSSVKALVLDIAEPCTCEGCQTYEFSDMYTFDKSIIKIVDTIDKALAEVTY